MTGETGASSWATDCNDERCSSFLLDLPVCIFWCQVGGGGDATIL